MLAFSQHGEGKTVVFLHGFLESSSMWKNLIFPFVLLRELFIESESELKVTKGLAEIHMLDRKVSNILIFIL